MQQTEAGHAISTTITVTKKVIYCLSCCTRSTVFSMCNKSIIQMSCAEVVNLPAGLQGSKAPSSSDSEGQLLLTGSPLSFSLLCLALFPLLLLHFSVCALRPWADDGFSPRLSRTFKFSLVYLLLYYSPARKPSLPVTLCPVFSALLLWSPSGLSVSFLLTARVSSRLLSLYSLLSVCHSHTRLTHPAAPPASSCSRPSFKNFPSLLASVPPFHQNFHPTM